MKKSIKDYEWNKTRGKITPSDKNRNQMLELLNTTGKGFCLAKWSQVTMHLGNGLTHSCHHPKAHNIPLDELKKNPSALHNTQYKMKQRKDMLAGKRPAECDFCWRVEDSGEISDRVLKSIESYSSDHHDKIANLDGDEDIYPTYVEVSFGRTCNFKCSYCGPAYSSQWHQEIKSGGYYDLENMKYNIIMDGEDHIPHNEHNPYIDAFWKWFPEAYKHMDTFRVTGGEPLLIKDTWKLLDFLIENPNPNLNFAINSNGCPPDGMWEKFVEKIQTLMENNCVKTFNLFTSAEASGERNDYIRYGMNYDQWQKNIKYYLDNTDNTGITVMAAFNMLSISSFKDLLKWILELKQDYNYAGWIAWLQEKGYHVPTKRGAIPMAQRSTNKTHNRVKIDTPYIRAPKFMDAQIANPELVQNYLIPILDFIFDNQGTNEWKTVTGFDDWEVLKIKRNIISIINKAGQTVQDSDITTDKSIRESRVQFLQFVKEHDKRRNTDFLKTFPEFQNFLDLCEQEEKLYNNEKNIS